MYQDIDAARSGTLAVEAIGLRKNFGLRTAVKNVSLAVQEGTIFGLLGPNGAGKSTTIRMLLGLIDPDSGTRTVLGQQHPLRVARDLGYLPEERGLYPSMSVIEALAFLGALRGLPLTLGRERGVKLLQRYGLPTNEVIRNLSKGMAQLVQILGTIVHSPKILILDEPFSGLDPLNQERLEGLIKEEACAGTTVILSTHVIYHAERLCANVAILDGGEIRFHGSVDEARAHQPAVAHLKMDDFAPDLIAGILPRDAQLIDGEWRFEVPPEGIGSVLRGILQANICIQNVSVARPSLEDFFRAVVK